MYLKATLLIPVLAFAASGCAYELEPAVAFGACGQFDSKAMYGYPGLSVRVHGVISHVELGVPPDCSQLVAHGVREDSPGAWWFELTHAAGTEVLGIWAPAGPEPLVLGDEVTLSLEASQYTYAPNWVNLTVSNEDAPLFWMGEAGFVEGLAPPGLTLEEGPRVGRSRGHCSTVAFHELVADGVKVPFGAQVSVDDVLVSHGGVSREVGNRLRCADAFGAYAAAMMHRL